MKLTTTYVPKPWGRRALPPPFAPLRDGGDPIGEIWFDAPAGKTPRLLVKYIFTSEKLSIQVHPDDRQGRVRGLSGGKSECWYILDAEPGATLGLGTVRPLDADELRAAARDGSLEALMDWKHVRPGDFFLVEAGTVHSIGAGVSLIEIQQNVDVTYRLFDYGRPRALHLDDGVAVARAMPYPASEARHVGAGASGTWVLADCPQFLALYSDDPAAVRRAYRDRELWVVPLSGAIMSGQDRAQAGECLWLRPGEELTHDAGTHVLLGIAPV